MINRVKKVKSNHPYYFFPSIQEKNEEIGKTIDFLNENAFSCVIIVKDFNNDWTPIGIATRDDLYDRPRTDPLYEVIKTNIVKVNEGIDLLEANNIMINRGIHHLPVINKSGHLVGYITPRDITLRVLYNLLPNIDKDGRLCVGCSMKFENNPKILEEAILLEEAGANAIMFETENGYSKSYIEFIKQAKSKLKSCVIASGVSDYEGAASLFKTGAYVVKAGNNTISIPHI